MIKTSQVLLGEGDWGELPGSSGIFYDVRLKLISTYQYHQDFYFGEEKFLKVIDRRSLITVVKVPYSVEVKSSI